MAIHGIDTACYSFGELEPTRLSVSNLILNDNNYPINAKLSLEFPGMKEACIDVGWNGNKENRKIQYFGSMGSIVVENSTLNQLTIKTKQYERICVLDTSDLPLTKEWLHLLQTYQNSSQPPIYPQQGAIIRSVKWVEFANREIQNTSTELNDSIE
jgi:predicted dehydrogenase